MTNTAKGIGIIADTSADISYEQEKEWGVKMIPFYIDVDHQTFVDDEQLNKEELLVAMENSREFIRSACASPGVYLDAMRDMKQDEIIVLTISRKLSGSWDSARAAREYFLKEFPHKKVEVIDCLTAAAGAGLALHTLVEYVKEGWDLDTVTHKIQEFTKQARTFLVLDSLDVVIKNGRVPLLKGKIAKMLGIKLVLGSNGEGEIIMYDKHRGLKRTMQEMGQLISSLVECPEEKTLFISYAGSAANALQLKELLTKHLNWKDVVVNHTRGVCTMYAQRNDVIVAF